MIPFLVTHLLLSSDIKPENFLIDHTGHVKLTDFGLSKGRLSEVKVHSLRAKLDAIHFPSLPRPSFSEKRSLNRLWRTEEPARVSLFFVSLVFKNRPLGVLPGG